MGDRSNQATAADSKRDVELVEACRSGDVDAFAELVGRYQQLVCAVSFSACGDLALSEDIAQEVFVTAWSDFDKLREPAKLKSWLCSIARNLARDVRRKRRREVTQADSDLDRERDSGPTPHQIVESSQRSDVVWGALAEIPENYREPLVLFYREGQSLKQVASLLGLTITTVKQRLSRGRKALRGSLAPIAAALVDTAPGKAFTAVVIAAALGRTKIAAAATGAAALAPRPAPDTITAGEAVSRPAAALGAGAATKLIAGGAAAAIAVGALWYLTRPDDRTPPPLEPVESLAAASHKPLPTLYGAAVEPADERGAFAVSGVVVDVLDNPIAGAVVTVSGKTPRTAIADADGRFRITGLADRVYGIDAYTEVGSAPPLAFRAASSRPLVLRIEPGSTLEITAIDAATDKVMPGVEVELETELRTTAGRTDDQGVAVFHGVTAHQTQVKLRADGYAAMNIGVSLSGQPGTNRRRFVLRRGEPVEGLVLDPAGQPVSGARVMLDGGIKLMAFDSRGIETDREGRWRIAAVAPGRYEVLVEHDRFKPAAGELVVPPANEGGRLEPLTTRLAAGHTVRGRVLGADGAPVPAAQVTAFGLMMQKRVTASASGEFEIEGLPDEPFKITAERYPETGDVVTVEPSRGIPASVTVRLADACIRGRVIDSAGRPVIDGRVRAFSFEVDVYDLYESSDRTDGHGRFALCRLQRDHRYGISAIADGVPLFFLYEDAPMTRAKAGDSSVTVKLGEPGVIVGEIGGDVPAEFGVALSRDRRGAPAEVTIPFSGTDGEFALTDIPAGTYTVVVAAEGRSTAAHRNVEVKPGGVVELPPSILDKPLQLGGVVVDGAGAPVAGARVHAGRGLGGNGRDLIEVAEGGDIDGDPNGPGANIETTTSGPDGRFSIAINALSSRYALVVAEHPRLGRSVPQLVKLGSSGHRVKLAATGSLFGTVKNGRGAMVAAYAIGVDGRPTELVLTAPAGADGSYRFDVIGAGRWVLVSTSDMDFPTVSSPGAVEVAIGPGASVKRDLAIAGRRPPWDEAGLREVDAIVEAACDCETDACRGEAERSFRAALQSRDMPSPEVIDRTDAAIERFERCMGFK